MWWKIYFWVLIILSVIGLLGLGSISFSLTELRGFIENILIILGTYSFIFNRKIFRGQTWNIIFWYLVVFWTLDFLHAFGLNYGPGEVLFAISDSSRGPVIFSVIVGLPALYAISKLRLKK